METKVSQIYTNIVANSVLRSIGGIKNKGRWCIKAEIGGAGVILRCRRLGLKSDQKG